MKYVLKMPCIARERGGMSRYGFFQNYEINKCLNIKHLKNFEK